MAVQQRLESLDALRGLDLFFLVGLEGVLHPLSRAVEAPWFKSFMWNFTHVEWEGFSPWDLVMPLFLFMAGVSIPFALGRSKGAADNTPVYRRIGRRFVLLWLFGMMCQGNLLGLDPSHLYLYSNTLQTIAVGYVIAALLFLHTSWKTQSGIALALLLAYWAALEGISVDGFGGGDYTPDGNLAEWVDRTVLGRFRDGATVDASGAVVFAPWYRYTWLLSSGNFGVTVLSGCLAGQLLRHPSVPPVRKAVLLLLIGAALVAAGWLWHLELPVIKKLWTSSMVLVSSGYCFLLMGLSYYWIDCRRHRKGLGWLKVYGMNSITAYMLASCVSFSSVSRSLLYGFEQYTGSFYPVLIAAANSLLLFGLLYVLYRNKLFLKV